MNPFKHILLDIIDFVRFKVDTNACTPEEMQSVFKLLSEQTITKATTKDIADFYGQSPSNVRNIVSRWGIKGESRRYYDFAKLQEYVPKSWRKPKSVVNTEGDEYSEPIVMPYIDAPTLSTKHYDDCGYNIAAESETTYGKH